MNNIGARNRSQRKIQSFEEKRNLFQTNYAALLAGQIISPSLYEFVTQIRK